MGEATTGGKPSRIRRAHVVLAMKLVVAAFLVWWLARSGLLDVKRLEGVRLGLDLVGVGAGLALSMGIPLARWHLLLRARGVGLSLGTTAQIGLIGYFATIVLPATGGQDLVRVVYASRGRTERAPDVLATVLLDRFTGLLGIAVLGVTAGAALRVGATTTLADEALTTRLVVVSAALASGLGAVTVLAVSRPPFVGRLGARVKKVDQLLTSFASFQRHRGALGWSLALAVVAQLGNCIAYYFALRAFDAPVSLLGAMAVTPLVTLSSIIPVTPLGIGVMDATAEQLFHVAGSSAGAEATMLVRAVLAAFSLVSGLAYLWPMVGPARASAE
jgi:uncharacterized membrane protein YbhN (UPF0104 family)